jgi:tRNA threonylcarbamoyladenosine biosynthesis protein TsaB
VFSGSGALKWSKIAALENSTFLFDTDITEAISRLSYNKFKQGDFTDLKYSEPLYVKEFFSCIIISINDLYSY